MRNCNICKKEYQESWQFNVYQLINEDCGKCYTKKYCPHIYRDKYDRWIQEARENLIKAKSEGDKILEDWSRELLRENQSYKKSTLKEHLKFCISHD